MKIHLSFRRNQLCNLNARFLMCAIYHQTNPKKIDSLKDVFCGKRSCLAYSSWMILMKIHLSFKRNQLCNLNARFFMCAICHQTNQKKIDSLKDLFSWKKSMLDLFFMNDFNEDSSELPEKSIVQFESKPNTKSPVLALPRRFSRLENIPILVNRHYLIAY